MSWSTLVCGEIEFKDIATQEEWALVENYLEFGNECEKVEVKTAGSSTTVSFTSVKWGGHITEDSIKEMLRKLCGKLKSYAISLYNLDDSVVEFTKNP